MFGTDLKRSRVACRKNLEMRIRLTDADIDLFPLVEAQGKRASQMTDEYLVAFAGDACGQRLEVDANPLV